MEDNTPYGFEDPGIKVRYSGKAGGDDEHRKYLWDHRMYPSTPEEADIFFNKLRKQRQALNNDNILRFQKEGE